jgi:hypothetical protein
MLSTSTEYENPTDGSNLANISRSENSASLPVTKWMWGGGMFSVFSFQFSVFSGLNSNSLKTEH